MSASRRSSPSSSSLSLVSGWPIPILPEEYCDDEATIVDGISTGNGNGVDDVVGIVDLLLFLSCVSGEEEESGVGWCGGGVVVFAVIVAVGGECLTE